MITDSSAISGDRSSSSAQEALCNQINQINQMSPAKLQRRLQNLRSEEASISSIIQRTLRIIDNLHQEINNGHTEYQRDIDNLHQEINDHTKYQKERQREITLLQSHINQMSPDTIKELASFYLNKSKVPPHNSLSSVRLSG